MKTIIEKRGSYRVMEDGKMLARFPTRKEAEDFAGIEKISVSGVPYKVDRKDVNLEVDETEDE